MQFNAKRIIKTLIHSFFKFAGLFFVITNAAKANATQDPFSMECSENADLFFRMRAMGTFSHLAAHGCNNIAENLADVSNRGLLFGVQKLQEIRMQNNRVISTNVEISDTGIESEIYEIKGLKVKHSDDPKISQVYVGVMGKNGENCKDEYTIKCKN